MDDDKLVADLLNRAAPHGPEPDGWAANARRRSNRVRASVGVAAVAVVALVTFPLVSPMADFVGNKTPAAPAPASPTETELSWEPPAGCLSGDAGQGPSVPLSNVKSGAHCYMQDEGSFTMANQLGRQELEIVLEALEESLGNPAEGMVQCLALGTDEDGNELCPSPIIGTIWLESDEGGRILVTEQRDGSLLWTDEHGFSWMTLGSDLRTNAALDGVLSMSRAAALGADGPTADPGVCFGWAGELEWSKQGLGAAVGGVLCDPTGTSAEDAERELPADVVTTVAEAMADERTRGDSRAYPSGWSLILKDADGAVFHLNQLSDGSITYQDPDGGEWSWVPSGAALEALRGVGMAHLHG